MTSVGKKIGVAVTGLGLCGFVFMHMAGNMLILVGPEMYNKYSYKLISNPLIYVAEVGLVAIFAVHVFLALGLTLENKKARPIAPAKAPSSCSKAARFGSQYMALSGLLVFVFLVLHLWTFKFGTHYSVTYEGVEMRDIYRLVIEEFHKPLYVGWYLLCLAVLGIHLSHGTSALFQSLGIGSVRCKNLKIGGWVFAALVAGGFCLQPLYVLLFTSLSGGGN